jgi:hypothetical protein
MTTHKKIQAHTILELEGYQTSPATEVAPASKISIVKNLLSRSMGASLDELVSATGWLPHTARAALTGLRKKGHQIERRKVDGVSRYVLLQETIA